MDGLARTVLAMIRTDEPLVGDAALNHGVRMNQAVDVLQQWRAAGPREKYLVATEALNQAVDLQGQLNDLDGPVGRAVLRLVRLHPQLAIAAQAKPHELVDWMIVFQFYARHRFLFLNPLEYLPVLGEHGIALYEDSLRGVELGLPPRPGQGGPDELATLVDWQTLDQQRRYVAEMRHQLNVVPHDVSAQGASSTFSEAGAGSQSWGEPSSLPAIGNDPQQWAYDAARRWWLLACEFHPEEIAAARLAMFRLRPSCRDATALYEAATPREWAKCRFEVLALLEQHPAEAVQFVLETLEDVHHAWDLAQLLGLDPDHPLWESMVAFEANDSPAADGDLRSE